MNYKRRREKRGYQSGGISTLKCLIFAVYFKLTSYNFTLPGDFESVQFRIGNKICLLTKRRPQFRNDEINFL